MEVYQRLAGFVCQTSLLCLVKVKQRWKVQGLQKDLAEQLLLLLLLCHVAGVTQVAGRVLGWKRPSPLNPVELSLHSLSVLQRQTATQETEVGRFCKLMPLELSCVAKCFNKSCCRQLQVIEKNALNHFLRGASLYFVLRRKSYFPLQH